MFHQIEIIGNLGQKPEIRHLASGQQVTTLSVASTRRYLNSQGQTVSETIWFKVSVWGKQAKSCADFLDKGSKVFVIGRLQPDEKGSPRLWKRSDGSFGASFEVTAAQVRFLTYKGSGGAGGGAHGGDEMGGGEEIMEPAGGDDVPMDTGGLDEVPF